jgi:3',5'-cyclic-AMP phosphodiesterase
VSNPRSASLHGARNSVSEEQNHADGVDRRGFLKCLAWAGTGVVWTLSVGILSSCTLSQASNATPGDFSFVQVSDSHIGFKNVPNMDVPSTFQKAIDRVGGLSTRPSFILHTGDVSHLSMPAQYDTVDQIFKSAKFTQDQVYYVPGEHDTFVDNARRTWTVLATAALPMVGRASTSRASTSSGWLMCGT